MLTLEHIKLDEGSAVKRQKLIKVSQRRSKKQIENPEMVKLNRDLIYALTEILEYLEYRKIIKIYKKESFR